LTLLPPFVKESWGEIICSLSFAPSLEKGRLGRDFISPLCPPSSKRGEGKRKLLPRGGKIKKAEGRVGEKLSGLFPLLLPLKREGWEGFSI